MTSLGPAQSTHPLVTLPLLQRMAFKGEWRDYQQRVLDEFQLHSGDRRLHLVAAPGSGKTVVGLEMIRRIGRPALVLAPTQIVRDQWLARLVPLFLDSAPDSAEISRLLDEPASLTVATYQALHALAGRSEDGRLASLANWFNALGSPVLVLDEAHHLRREWWAALTLLVEALPEAHIIALTATPPYDAPPAEWARYEEMCGPIDMEVSVPELVRNGDLCPHQDHVHISRPNQDALELLARRQQGVSAFQQDVRADTTLLDFLESHPWLAEPATSIEAILDAPEVLSSILVLLASAGRRLPQKPLALLGVRAKEVPPPDSNWLEILLNALLFDHADTFPIGPERKRVWRARLHEFGLIEGGAVKLGESRATFQAMANSVAKIGSIVEIARAEADALGARLRMVILSDHVRAAELSRCQAADYLPSKLGVVPIFAALQRAGIEGQLLAVLTGSLIILPAAVRAQALEAAEALNLDAMMLDFVDMPSCPGFLRVSGQGEGGRRLVEIITHLFCAGHITMLVGTQALLGEGWDAPALNSLVLASNSAAFMLSNQMRGRAIRMDPSDPLKVANIWHLATSDCQPRNVQHQFADRIEWNRLGFGDAITSDFELLERRFRAFDGISSDGPCRIENGLGRLGLHDAQSAESCNAQTLVRARDRDAIAQRWRVSLGEAKQHQRVREAASPNYVPRGLSMFDTLQWLAASAATSGAFAAANEVRSTVGDPSLPLLAMAAAGAATVAMAPKLLKAAWLFVRNGSVEGNLAQVARAVVEALETSGMLPGGSAQAARAYVDHDPSGRIDLSLDGLSRSQERLVLEAIAEVLGPVRNPRYLLVRRNSPWLRTRCDYHAVPAVLAARKEWAEMFLERWRHHVGASQLVFTRNVEGRLLLLRARARSFAAGFQRRVDRHSAWR